METFQDALTEYKNTPGYDGLAPTQWAFGHLQRKDVPAPKSAYERITDEKLLEHIGRRGQVLRSVMMNGPKRSSETFNPGDKVRVQDKKTKLWDTLAVVVEKVNDRTYMLKSGGKTLKRNAKFIRRSTVPDESQEVSPLERRRHSGGRKQPPFEAKFDHTASVIGPVTRSRART